METHSKTNRKRVILDATTLNTLMGCPCLVDLRFNHRFQSINGKPNSLEVGSLAHKILEVFYQERIKGFDRKTSIGAGLIAGNLYITSCKICTGHTGIDKPECGHQPNEYPGLVNTPPHNENKPKRIGWQWVLDTMEQYFERWANEVWVPLEVEKVVGKVLYEDDNISVLWKAKLDLLADTLEGINPIDHKTMSQNRPTLSLDNQFIGQCHVSNSAGVVIDKIGWQTSLPPKEKFIRNLVSYSKSRLLEWQSLTLPQYAYDLLQYHETGYWPMRLTHCETKYGRCQFVQVCEGEPDDRERILRENFIVGEVWDPTND